MRMEKQLWKSRFCDSLTVTDKCIKTCFQPILYELQSMKQQAVLFSVRFKIVFSPKMHTTLNDF